MFDQTGTAIRFQRSSGAAHVALKAVDGRARLTDLGQRGSAKVFLPRNHAPDPEIVFLNSAGGLASGDHLQFGLDIGASCRAVATTQTAERAYRCDGPPARAEVSITVGAGAALAWLPQETILYDGTALTRRTHVDLLGDARCLMLESIVLGRAAMGEVVTRLDLSDRREIRRDGRMIALDPLRLNDAVLARRQSVALLGGAGALATIILAAPDASALLTPLRAHPATIELTVSAPRDDLLILRALAPDGWSLRQQMIGLIPILHPGPLPRTWQI